MTSYSLWHLWNPCIALTGYNIDTTSGDTRNEILCSQVLDCLSDIFKDNNSSIRGRWPWSTTLCISKTRSLVFYRNHMHPSHSFEKGCLHREHFSCWTQMFSLNCLLEEKEKWIRSTLKWLMIMFSAFVGQLIRYYKKGPSQCTLKNPRGAHSW